MMWVRSLGIFQVLELKAYDQLLRLRLNEGRDPRLVVVEATEPDIQKYGGFPLPDATLAQVIDRLEQHQPRVIGLDIFRPVVDGHPELISHFQNNNHLIAICAAKEAHNPDKSTYSPPPGLPEDRLGFSDAVNDNDAIRRRHLLFIQPDKDDPCTTEFSFSARIALYYLKEVKHIEATTLSKDEIKIDKTIFKRLQTNTGAYKNLDNRGFQIILNYRASRDVAQRVSFSQVLEGKVAPDLVKNKIILIGVTGQSSGDFVFTPYSAHKRPYQPMPGVLIQAHGISQILSAVLDGRPLLWVWSQWGEAFWLWGWSLLGGVIVWRCQGILSLAVATGVIIVILHIVCFGFLTHGGWVPLVPSALALVATSGVRLLYKNSPNYHQFYKSQ
ncbi:MAG: CHASE2 domain-containing protein [Moorea sp. SIO3I6]|nr:CHASE2 domain-containing protein [Moorena sp. SIO3I6]